MFVKGEDATVRAATYDKIKEKCAIVKEGVKVGGFGIRNLPFWYTCGL